MTKAMGALAISAALFSAAVGFAASASADAPDGTYLRVMGASGDMFQSTVTYTPCGPDCVHAQTSGTAAYDLYLQGAVWTGAYALNSGKQCTVTLDPAALTERHICEGGTDALMTLTKV